MLAIVLTFIAFKFLKGNENDLPEDKKSDITNKLNSYEEKINDLYKKLSIYESKDGLSKEEKKEIINTASKQTNEDAIKKIFSEQTSELQIYLKTAISLDSIENSSKRIIKRIKDELYRLDKYSRTNLLIGLFVTVFAVMILYATINSRSFIEIKSMLDVWSIFLSLLPTFSLVLLIEIFAFFFLRLYKENLTEIKYFQNELTNIELKMMAVEVAYITNKEKALEEAISALTNTERNYVLKKGETTVELERAKSDTEVTKSMLSGFGDFMKNVNKK